MPARLGFTVETLKRNNRLTQYDADKVFEPFAEVITIVETFQQRKVTTDADSNLTPKAFGTRRDARAGSSERDERSHAQRL